jgi:hypothetical protein
MRRYRAFEVVICAVMLAVTGCNKDSAAPASAPAAVSQAAQVPATVTSKQIPIVLSSESMAGYTFQQGDTLTWTALKESKQSSYQLKFTKKNPACNLGPKDVVTVTPTQSFSCQGMKPGDDGNAVYYKIKAIRTPKTPPPNPIPGPSPGGIGVYSATPCKQCNNLN